MALTAARSRARSRPLQQTIPKIMSSHNYSCSLLPKRCHPAVSNTPQTCERLKTRVYTYPKAAGPFGVFTRRRTSHVEGESETLASLWEAACTLNPARLCERAWNVWTKRELRCQYNTTKSLHTWLYNGSRAHAPPLVSAWHTETGERHSRVGS